MISINTIASTISHPTAAAVIGAVGGFGARFYAGVASDTVINTLHPVLSRAWDSLPTVASQSLTMLATVLPTAANLPGHLRGMWATPLQYPLSWISSIILWGAGSCALALAERFTQRPDLKFQDRKCIDTICNVTCVMTPLFFMQRYCLGIEGLLTARMFHGALVATAAQLAGSRGCRTINKLLGGASILLAAVNSIYSLQQAYSSPTSATLIDLGIGTFGFSASLVWVALASKRIPKPQGVPDDSGLQKLE